MSYSIRPEFVIVSPPYDASEEIVVYESYLVHF